MLYSIYDNIYGSIFSLIGLSSPIVGFVLIWNACKTGFEFSECWFHRRPIRIGIDEFDQTLISFIVKSSKSKIV